MSVNPVESEKDFTLEKITVDGKEKYKCSILFNNKDSAENFLDSAKKTFDLCYGLDQN